MKLALKFVLQNDGDFVDVILLYTEMGVRNTPFVTAPDLQSMPKSWRLVD